MGDVKQAPRDPNPDQKQETIKNKTGDELEKKYPLWFSNSRA